MFNTLKNNFVNNFFITTSAFKSTAEVVVHFKNKWSDVNSFSANATLVEQDKYFNTYRLVLSNIESGIYDYIVFINSEIYKRGRANIEINDGTELSCIFFNELTIFNGNINLLPNFEVDLQDGNGCQLYQILESSL